VSTSKRERISALLATIDSATRELAELLSTQERTPRVRVIDTPPEVSDTEVAFARREIQRRGWHLPRTRK
jgi:hypothetical protein